MTIDGCEADVRNLIELLQLLPQAARRFLPSSFPFGAFLQLRLDSIRDGFELLDAHRTLLGSRQEPCNELLTLEPLPVPILLDDAVFDVLDVVRGS